MDRVKSLKSPALNRKRNAYKRAIYIYVIYLNVYYTYGISSGVKDIGKENEIRKPHSNSDHSH